ncbi:MAG: amidohydrolase family protein [Pirellulales bacterium]
MNRCALRARYVFPVDAAPLEDAVVCVEGKRIVAVGENVFSTTPRALGQAAILPGLVNAHAHLEFSDLDRPLGTRGMPLPDWIRLVIAHRSRRVPRLARPAVPSAAIARGLAECLAGGATTIGEIACGQFSDYASGARSAAVVALLEVIGFSGLRWQSALTAVLEKLDAPDAPPQLAHGLCPHAPYTVHPELVSRLAELSVQRKIPIAFHLAESPEELRLLRDGDGPFQELLQERSMWDEGAIPRGSRPLDYLKRLAAAKHVLVIHGNYLDNEELELLAAQRNRMSLIYCPRTHAYFDHQRYPLAKALALGVNVAVGTDSRASNPDLSLWSELRWLAAHHPDVRPHDLLALGTRAGAVALGQGDAAGTLRPGNWANLTVVGLPQGRGEEPHELLLDQVSRVREVWLRGQPVYSADAGQQR